MEGREWLSAFRDPGPARALVRAIASAAGRLDRQIRIMEVCGTHTMAIARFGIRGLLPRNVRLISGPGCPVCVTGSGYIDAAVELAGRPRTVVCTFGDLLRVPGGSDSLAGARARGGRVQVVYSPADALAAARAEPGQTFVFLGIGFETTIPVIGASIEAAVAAGIGNYLVLPAFKVVPPTLQALLSDPENRIDGLLCPAHVSAIIGSDAYLPVAARHRVPCVVAGFETLDILHGILGLIEQAADCRAEVDNRYERVVRPAGNPAAQAVIRRLFEPCDTWWRGIGMVPGTGLAFRPEFRRFDAAVRFGIEVVPGGDSPGCRCGQVLTGRLDPPGCPLYGTQCTPEQPRGPCMVSGEGSCAAWFRYGGEG